MTMPAGIATVTLTGRYIRPDGTPLSGTVTISSPSLLTLAGADTIATGATTITLDTAGTFSAVLIATDNASMQPTGWAYTITEKFVGVTGRTYSILLPSTTPTVNLADIAPADPSAGNYIAVAGPQGAPGTNGTNGTNGANGSDGADGRTILSGLAAPSNAVGVDGDFYIDTNAWSIYGPKASGAWPAGHSLSPSSGGAVASVNDQTGTVVLTASSVGALAAAGGTLSGALEVNKFSAASGYPIGLPGAVNSVSIPSTFAGGEDDGNGTDSTGRLNLYSYQRADVKSFGETIRHFAMRKDSKQMEAWYFPAGGYDGSRNPVGAFKPVVWAGAHWEANNHASNHKHWSVETPDSTGAIQTRFEVRWGDPNNDSAIAGLDKTLVMTNLADFVVRCTNGQELRLSSPTGQEKGITFSHDYAGGTTYRRWRVRATSDAESGSSTGTDFQLVAYDDTGTLITQALHAQRSTGNIGLGTTAPDAKLHVKRATGQVVHVETGATSQGAILVDGFDATVKALQSQVAGDTNKRFQALVDGAMSWGPGNAASDTTLYRANTGRLKTDTAFHVGTNMLVNTTSTGGGVGVVGVANATTVPATNPTAGGVLYAEGGALKWRGSNGTVTVIAPA
ncbi:hypothetical protein ACWCO0_09670 [Streptomyces tubercidicus]